MSKYTTFFYADIKELVFSKGEYNVYRTEAHGRYYLVKKGKQVAFSNVTDNRPNFLDWIAKWEQNARKQIDKLEDRIADLRNEQDEIFDLLN